MPLHLLGKKSWNVYNQENIARVRRDEADAKAREEADEQRMQEEDAHRRIALLRGEQVAPLPPPSEEKLEDSQRWRAKASNDTYAQRDLKRKRRRGEDDTDRDIRYAKEGTVLGEKKTRELLSSKEKEAPLEDHAGHFQLIPAPDEGTIRKGEKHAEVEAEKEKKRKREEDQYTMRFSNAAGFQNGMQKPWYTTRKESNPSTAPSSTKEMVLAEVQGKDVWGNEDPRRKEREQNRISSNDPFAAMQAAQRQLKQSEMDKESWQRKQKAELEQVKKDEKWERRSRRSRRHDDEDILDGFSLDAPTQTERERSSRDRYDGHSQKPRHRRQQRSRSRERDKGRNHKHRHKHRHKD